MIGRARRRNEHHTGSAAMGIARKRRERARRQLWQRTDATAPLARCPARAFGMSAANIARALLPRAPELNWTDMLRGSNSEGYSAAG
jgi:hypothetical protein